MLPEAAGAAPRPRVTVYAPEPLPRSVPLSCALQALTRRGFEVVRRPLRELAAAAPGPAQKGGAPHA